MADDLEDVWAEASAEDAGDLDLDVGAEVDNPVDGADDIGEDQADDDFSDDTDTEDSQDETDDQLPPEDSDEDDFDWDAFADQKVTIKDNGEDRKVDLRELKNGYLRHQDYSRKTAELAEDRKFAEWGKDVQQSFQKDPLGTLKSFADALGVQIVRPGQQQAAPENGQTPQGDPYEDLDPDVAAIMRRMDAQEARHKQELQAVAQRVQSREAEQLKAEVRAEMQELQTQYGEDLDPLSALQLAANRNIPLSEAAEIVVFRAQRARGAQAQQAGLTAQEAAARRAAATEKARKGQKRQAAGSSRRSYDTVASEVNAGDFNDIGDLFEIVANET